MREFQCKSKVCWYNEVYEDELAPLKCPKCGSRNYRLSYPETKRVPEEYINIDGSSRGNPRLSWSMGVNRADIPAMMKKYPDRTYHPKTGQLLVESRQHKKRLMREHGFEELS